MLQSVAFLAEGDDVEVSVGSGHVCFYASFYEGFLLEAVGDEVAYADDFEIVLASHLLELWHTSHCAVFVEDFDECCCRLQSREACQVNCCFCVACPTQYAFVLSVEGIDVPRAPEV